MKIFELHFNPKVREDYFFDSFIFEPSNAFERKLGSLYEIGELKNGLPQNGKFLDNLARAIKDRYFTLSSKTAEKALTESLKGANEFLDKELKKNNVSWLGNLNFAVLSLNPIRNRISNGVKDFELNFTKTGDIKILMLRGGAITDIGKSFEIEKIEPYPLKVFFNIISGKLAAQDIILATTKELYDYLKEREVIEKLAKAETLNESKIKEIFPKENFSEKEKIKTAGACLIIYLEKQITENKRAKNVFLPRKKEFSFSSIFAPLSKFFFAGKKSLYNLKILSKSAIKVGVKKTKKEGGQKIKVKGPSSIFVLFHFPKLETKKKIYLVIFLAILLLLGFLIFKKGKEEISSTNLEKQIEENLENLSNIDKIETPAQFYELKTIDVNFKPKGMSYSANNFFFYSKESKDIYNLNLVEERLDLINKEKNFDFVISDAGVVFLFSNPNTLSIYKNQNWQEKNIKFSLTPNISQIAAYYSNLYFLDNKYCRIIKLETNNNNNAPQDWLKEKLKQDCSLIKSIAVDGSLWLLNSDNSIDVYHKGNFQKTIKIALFPFAEDIIKIETKAGLPYLYLLEPSKKRIIVLYKEGKIFKQFFSEKFDDLKDFAVSADGKIIYLLNGNKVYSIEI